MDCAPPVTKLRVDFMAQSGRGRAMDDDTRELVAQLFTRIGMIMEDASVTALSVTGMDQEERGTALVELGISTRRISALVESAGSLLG